LNGNQTQRSQAPDEGSAIQNTLQLTLCI